MSRTPWFFALLSACTGVIADPEGTSAGPSETPPTRPRPEGEVCTPEVEPGDTPFRRLGRDEYRNTLAALLQLDVAPPQGLPEDEDLAGFPVGLVVSPLHTEVYFETAEELAALADLEALSPCVAAGEGDRACAEEFVGKLGARAYRRPLQAEEANRLLAVFEVAGDFDRGLRMVLEVLIQSPKTLYLVEHGVGPGAAGDVVPLSSYERASRLSYFLWGSMPDDTLFAAAASNELDDPSAVSAQARRMLDDPRARAWIGRFHREWLDVDLEHVDKDAALFPEWSTAYRAELGARFDAFVDGAFFSGAGSFESLIAGRHGDATRAGILTEPAFLARHANPERTSPVQRGARVRELVLCLPVPPPPDDVDTMLPPPIEGVTERERLAAHRADPTCGACHSIIDPLGLGFEHFDAIGRWRELDGGEPVDATGAIVGTASSDAEFDGATDLARLLARSEEVEACVSAKWLQYAIGRPAGTDDACALSVARDALERSGGDLRELAAAVTESDAFLYRRVSEGETR